MESTAQVLIAGAGPAGLYLALALLKNGISVRIVDKDQKFHVGSRGSGIFPRTFELMGFLGVLDDILRKSREIPPMRSYTSGPPEQAQVLKTWHFVDVVEPTHASPYGTGQAIDQSVHEAVIRDHLKKFGCEVELGVELVDFEQDDQGVNVKLCHHDEKGGKREERIRVSYAMGADGAKGPVRKLLKLSFSGETKVADGIAVADVEIKNFNTDPKYVHLWEQSRDNGPAMVMIRSLDPYSQTNLFFQVVVLGSFSEDEMLKFGSDPNAFQDQFQKISGRVDVTFDSVRWHSYFRPNMRMVNKFGEGRVFVVGDAAHVHSPTGGQGLNSSVQDSINLAWKLALVIKKLAPTALLDTYTEERLPVIAEMLRKTSGLYTQTYDEAKVVEAAKEMDAWRRGGELFMLGINYRWSSIVLEERDANLGDEMKRETMIDEMKARSYGGYQNGLCAGDRAPEAPGLLVSQSFDPTKKVGEETSLFKMLSPTKHSIVIFASVRRDAIQGLRAITQVSAKEEVIQTFLIRSASLKDEDGNASSSSATVADQQDGVGTTLIDRDGHAHNGYFVKDKELTVVIIRPDGYVGAITKDEAGIKRYFDKVLAH